MEAIFRLTSLLATIYCTLYLELGGAGQSACCHWGELGAWSRWLATPPGPVVVVVGDGGGCGDDGIDSAHHHHDPGAPSLDEGTEVGVALLAVAGAMADAVTFSKPRFLLHKKNTRHEYYDFLTTLFTVDDFTCPPPSFVVNFVYDHHSQIHIYRYTCTYVHSKYALVHFYNTWRYIII